MVALFTRSVYYYSGKLILMDKSARSRALAHDILSLIRAKAQLQTPHK